MQREPGPIWGGWWGWEPPAGTEKEEAMPAIVQRGPGSQYGRNALTPRARQVLSAIKVGPNGWAQPPQVYDVPEVLGWLSRHGFIERRAEGGYRQVRPTAKGWKQIEAERNARERAKRISQARR